MTATPKRRGREGTSGAMSTPGAAGVGGEVAEPRLGVVAGDRPCTGCGFNLVGQAIVRERHYGMLMARCPECGSVAALQEYPLLGRWAGRWAAVLAALWLAVLILGLAGSAILLNGVGHEVKQAGAGPLAVFISGKHKAFVQEQMAADAQGTTANLGWLVNQVGGAYDTIDLAWWRKQDAGALMAEAESAGVGFDRAAYWRAAWLWVWVVLVGMVWGVALPGVRRGRMWIPAGVILCVSSAIWVMSRGQDMTALMGWSSGMTIAQSLIGSGPHAATMVASAVPLVAGMWIGRPVARWVVRLLLTPRVAAGLSVLWTCDGKALPRA